MTDSSKLPGRLLFVALLSLASATFFAACGLADARGIAWGPELTKDGLDRFAQLLFGVMSILGFENPDGATSSWMFSIARISAVLFTVLAASGIVVEFYRPARTAFRRSFFRVRQVFGAEPVVVIGLGWIGRALAESLLDRGNVVYAIESDTDRAHGVQDQLSVAVVTGDATEPDVRSRAAMDHATDVFIATGSDTLNLEVAGELLDGESWSDAHPTACYVHVGDPSLTSTLRSKNLFAEAPSGVDMHLFCTRELAAQQFFLDTMLRRGRGILGPTPSAKTHLPTPVPLTANARIHIIVLGFGALGQAVALQTARFAHLPSGHRPRLTIIDPTASDKSRWTAFLQNHPAFAPADLSLDDLDAARDRWSDATYRATTAEYRTRDNSGDPPDPVGDLRANAVEYAVQAEYIPLYNDSDPGRFTDCIQDRLQTDDSTLHPYIVFCLGDEQESFQVSLDVQQSLARLCLDDVETAERSDDEIVETLRTLPEVASLHVNLAVETGLAHVLERQTDMARSNDPLPATRAGRSEQIRQRATNRQFPIYAFGQRGTFVTYDAVTHGAISEFAEAVQAVHGILSPHEDEYHPDFERSNIDSILFSEMRFAALGIVFREAASFAEEERQRALLYALSSHARRSDLDALPDQFPQDKKGRFLLTVEAFACLPSPIRERLALLGRVAEQSEEADAEDDNAPGDSEAQEEETARTWKEVTSAAVSAAIERFRAEIEDTVDPDIAARMEHNRWMGERLSEQWKFGPRSTMRKQRKTMIPWENLAETDQTYDRQQQPRLILAQQERGYWAFIEGPEAEPSAE